MADPDEVLFEAQSRLARRGVPLDAYAPAPAGTAGSPDASLRRAAAEARYDERSRLAAENRRLRLENTLLLDQLRIARVAQCGVAGPASHPVGDAAVIAAARSLLRRLPQRHPGLGLEAFAPADEVPP